MNNISLGKVLKAMYKLSGKTLAQLSDETDLTVDTINNLFYARVQKPGLIGVNALVNAMGFSVQQLISFLEIHPDLPEDMDVTDIFTKYIASATDTMATVASAKDAAKPAKGKFPSEVDLLNEEHEKELERYRATQQQHNEQLQLQHDRQIEQMQAHERQMEMHFDKTIAAIKETHAQEISHLEKENTRQRKAGKTLAIAFSIETLLVLLFLILDMINKGIGWLR